MDVLNTTAPALPSEKKPDTFVYVGEEKYLGIELRAEVDPGIGGSVSIRSYKAGGSLLSLFSEADEAWVLKSLKELFEIASIFDDHAMFLDTVDEKVFVRIELTNGIAVSLTQNSTVVIRTGEGFQLRLSWY